MTAELETDTRVLFAFNSPAAKPWYPTDDDVMGGHSRSRFVMADGTATFAGSVSLEAGGGFCSARSPDLASGLGGFAGVSLRVRGDGKAYTFCLHTRALMPGLSYRCRFMPPAGEWVEMTLPFPEFVLMRFGFRVGVEPVNPAHVRAVSLMIADKQEGPFALDVARIVAC